VWYIIDIYLLLYLKMEVVVSEKYDVSICPESGTLMLMIWRYATVTR
jgi:hypothetical protein